ncbi:MAG TPA: prepilin-type N-terminal cleavage/methylation domain-containing protein [Candidatus Dojkabacteria bacterium]|jgi:prepilin-type N-terminal cleavage/methylation domain-containing protein
MPAVDKLRKKINGFTLVEVLMVMLIFSSAIIVAMGVIINSARISVSNEISNRVNTLGVRVLEISKKPDGVVKNCSGTDNLELQPGLYEVGNIDYAAFLGENVLDSVCFQRSGATSLISECNSSNFETEIIFPQTGEYVQYDESYCIQLQIESVPNSEYSKITVRLIYDTLVDDDLLKEFFGYR